MNETDQQRHLRKQLLVARAALERAEFAEGLADLRRSTGWLGRWLPGLSNARSLPWWIELVGSSPLLGSALSGAIVRWRRPLLRYLALGAGAVLLGWQVWKSVQPGSEGSNADRSDPGAGN